jgi:hypothetical protein
LLAKQAHRERQLDRAQLQTRNVREVRRLMQNLLSPAHLAADDSLGAEERGAIGAEYRSVFEAAEAIATETKFMSEDLVSVLGEPGTYFEHDSDVAYLPRQEDTFRGLDFNNAWNAFLNDPTSRRAAYEAEVFLQTSVSQVEELQVD